MEGRKERKKEEWKERKGRRIQPYCGQNLDASAYGVDEQMLYICTARLHSDYRLGYKK